MTAVSKEPTEALREWPRCSQCDGELSQVYCGPCDEWYYVGHKTDCPNPERRDEPNHYYC